MYQKSFPKIKISNTKKLPKNFNTRISPQKISQKNKKKKLPNIIFPNKKKMVFEEIQKILKQNFLKSRKKNNLKLTLP